MRIFRLLVSLLLFFGCIYLLNSPVQIGASQIPPLGKFLDPFQGFLQNGERENYPFKNSIDLDILEEDVKVYYDSTGIPHIFAKNDNDLYLVQGYIVAQERLWQMEFQTHAAAGRVSEIIGKKGLNFDREQRRKGMVTGAEKSLREIEKHPDIMNQLIQFTKGVNLYINTLEYKDLPVEYKLLDYKPEPWTPLKSSLLIQYMVDQLIGSDGDIENTNALAHFGRETFELLYPEYTPGIEPVVPTFSPWNFDPLEVEPDSILYSTYDIQKISEANPENGSNNWAVSGSKTKSGHAILANDTHLGLNLPSLWIMMQLHSPNVNTTGFTFTGAPGIVLGFNENIAWGFTNAPRDQRDWYRLTYNPENKEEYLYKGKYIPLEYRYDSIFIRNEEPFIDTIKVTEVGPVVYDNNFPEKGSGTDLAFKWIGHNPSRVIVAISMLNRSTNYEDYKKALEYWDAPSQNVVFADTKGDIALRIEGTFPLKWKEQGKFIMDAGREKHLWSEYIPHDQNAFLLNPERGFVSSANQHSVDSLYPYYVYNESNETYRNRRINRMLSKAENTTVKDMMRMQYDSYSMLAEDVLWFFYDSLEIQGFDSTHFAYYHDLGNWNFTYTPNSITPSFFEAWWSSFKKLLWDEMDVKGMELPVPNDFQTTYLIKNQKDLPFFDIDSTEYKESLKTLINLSYSEAVEQMDKWKRKYGNNRWGTINNVTIKHLTRIPAFSTSTLEVPGSGDAINAANGNHGPSQRIIVEMTSPPTAWVALPGGQSGNPGSPRYMDYLENYKNGKYSPLQLYLNLPTDTLGFNQEFKRK